MNHLGRLQLLYLEYFEIQVPERTELTPDFGPQVVSFELFKERYPGLGGGIGGIGCETVTALSQHGQHTSAGRETKLPC